MDITPMLCGSRSRTRVYRPCSTRVMRYLPSPYDIGEIVGMNPDNEEEAGGAPQRSRRAFLRLGV